MSTLTNIFAPSAADQAEAGSSQPTDAAIDDVGGAQVAPPMPELPGTDGGSGSVDSGGTDDFDAKAPDVLMPGGPMDPEA